MKKRISIYKVKVDGKQPLEQILRHYYNQHILIQYICSLKDEGAKKVIEEWDKERAKYLGDIDVEVEDGLL